MHVHLDHDSCMEVTVLRGPVDEVRHFADHVTRSAVYGMASSFWSGE